MLRLRSGSTLFPYTTLFRSGVYPPGRRVVRTFLTDDAETCHVLAAARLAGAAPESIRWTVAAPASRAAASTDRKSTRLNSSHSQISYAVFCLKKKTQRKTST